MTGFVTFALIGAVSWVLRVGFLVLIPVRRLPPAVRAGLDDLAPAVLAAIVALGLADLLARESSTVGALETLAAGAVVAVIAWKTRSLAAAALLALVAVAAIDLVLT
jgi:branched-subunit amino acid transport protein